MKSIAYLALALFTLSFSSLQAQKPDAKKSKKDPALLVFGDKATVFKSDFEYVYQKNNGGWC